MKAEVYAMQNEIDECLSQAVRLHALIGQLIDELVSRIVNSEKFQQLERRWISLKLLCDAVNEYSPELRKNVEIFLLDVRCEIPGVSDDSSPGKLSDFELWDDVTDHADVRDSVLFNRIYRKQYNTPGETPFSLILCDQEYWHHPNSINFLRGISQISEAAFAVFMGGVSPRLFKLESFAQLSALAPQTSRGPKIALKELFSSNEYLAWEQFRRSDAARYVALVMPEVELRSAYDFEESLGIRCASRERSSLASDVRRRQLDKAMAETRKEVEFLESRLMVSQDPSRIRTLQSQLTTLQQELTEANKSHGLLTKLAETVRAIQNSEDETQLAQLEEELERIEESVSIFVSNKKPYSAFTERRHCQDSGLFGNASVALAAVAIRTFLRTGWLADMHGIPRATQRGGFSPIRSTDGYDPVGRAHLCQLPTTNVVFSDRLEKQLSGDLGLVCLTHRCGSQYASFCTTPTLHVPRSSPDDRIHTSNRMASMLHYVLCTNHFAHYIKVHGHTWVGSAKPPEEIKGLMEEWLGQFRLLSGDAEDKAAHPLSDFSVEVSKFPGREGHYQCKVMLEPHRGLDTVQVTLATELEARA